MKKKSVEKCLRCHGPLSNYNTRKFCNACQGNLEARFPVYVTFQEDDDITLDWWTSPEEFKRMIKDGKKRITIRRGYRDIRIEKLLFEGIKDETLQYEVEVIEVRHILISKVSDEIAREDGFENWVNFYRMMKKYYPDLDVSEECTLIYFE